MRAHSKRRVTPAPVMAACVLFAIFMTFATRLEAQSEATPVAGAQPNVGYDASADVTFRGDLPEVAQPASHPQPPWAWTVDTQSQVATAANAKRNEVNSFGRTSFGGSNAGLSPANPIQVYRGPFSYRPALQRLSPSASLRSSHKAFLSSSQSTSSQSEKHSPTSSSISGSKREENIGHHHDYGRPAIGQPSYRVHAKSAEGKEDGS